MTFTITHEHGPRACVVRLVGDIDISVVPELRQQLGDALGGGCGNIVLDLTEVDYADSSALGMLVWLDRMLRPAGGRLVLAGASRDVSRILELSGLVHVAASIAMSANVDAALEGLELSERPSELLWEQEIEMPADVNALSAVREEVCGLIAPLGFPESSLFDIKVALGEALANAIRHGSPDQGSATTVRVNVMAYSDRVAVEVVDRGPGFDGVHSVSEDLYAPGGRGVMFMRALMDRVEFETPEGGGTSVRLVKHRAGADS